MIVMVLKSISNLKCWWPGVNFKLHPKLLSYNLVPVKMWEPLQPIITALGTDSYPFCSILLGPQLGITFAEIHSHIVDHREFHREYSWYMAQRRLIHYVLIHGVQINRPEFKIYIFFINHLHKLFDDILIIKWIWMVLGKMHDYVHRRSVRRTDS